MIRLGNTVRHGDRLWIVSGRSHRTDGSTRLILVDEQTNDTAIAPPDDVIDLGDFSRPVAHGGYAPPEGTSPVDGNTVVGPDAERPAEAAGDPSTALGASGRGG